MYSHQYLNTIAQAKHLSNRTIALLIWSRCLNGKPISQQCYSWSTCRKLQLTNVCVLFVLFTLAANIFNQAALARKCFFFSKKKFLLFNVSFVTQFGKIIIIKFWIKFGIYFFFSTLAKMCRKVQKCAKNTFLNKPLGCDDLSTKWSFYLQINEKTTQN